MVFFSYNLARSDRQLGFPYVDGTTNHTYWIFGDFEKVRVALSVQSIHVWETGLFPTSIIDWGFLKGKLDLIEEMATPKLQPLSCVSTLGVPNPNFVRTTRNLQRPDSLNPFDPKRRRAKADRFPPVTGRFGDCNLPNLPISWGANLSPDPTRWFYFVTTRREDEPTYIHVSFLVAAFLS